MGDFLDEHPLIIVPIAFIVIILFMILFITCLEFLGSKLIDKANENYTFFYKSLSGEEGEAKYCGKNYGMLYCETENEIITVESFTRGEKEKK